ncbi:MAG: hypothetical protein PHC75_09775 [Burkholderiales bacterium]|nr:hypothetical protein [Burkholderiales bacterium]
MLSLNFNLVRRSGLLKLDKIILLYVFAIFFVDFYDTTLYIGYSIYLRGLIFPTSDVFEAIIKFAAIFVLVQSFKISGFIMYSYIMHYQRKLTYLPLLIFFISSIGLAFFWGFGFIGKYAIHIFLLLRLCQAFAIGAEICSALKIINSNIIDERTKMAMYYFILFAGECGILVSVFINRMLLSHGITLLQFMSDWKFQLVFSALLALLAISVKLKYLNQYTYNTFSKKVFAFTVIRYWKLILIRAGVSFYSFLLILIVVIRIPYILEYEYKLSHETINHDLLLVTLMGFIGANVAYIASKYIENFSLMLFFYVLSMIANCYFYQVKAFENTYSYVTWILITGFFYGVFLRMTPHILNSVTDFNSKNRLIGRYISYFFVYTVCSSIVIFCLDFMHYANHALSNDKKLADVPILFILLCSSIGFLALLAYKPYYKKNYNRQWVF